MSAVRCPRSWQAEAIADGRLSGAERSAFERHLLLCAECRAEASSLAQLKRLSESLPLAALSPLERRRLRSELLRRANQNIVEPAPVWPRLAWLFGALLLVLGLLGAIQHYRARPVERADLGAPTFQLWPGVGCQYRQVELGKRTSFSLAAGELTVQVDPLAPGQGFSIRLPDGELEVRGTRFSVHVEQQHTQRVSVREGRVALRISGEAARLLAAGESFQRSSDAASSAPPAAPASAAPAPVTLRPRSKPSRSAPRVATSGASKASLNAAAATATAALLAAPASAAPPAAASPAAALPKPRSESAFVDGKRFGAAMAAFSAGDFGHAEQLFQEFERQHAGDARREDAAFLRAVALLRQGDRAGAELAARDYLRRYPHGLRVREARQIAR